ncbi:MAG: GIY-YIG nuclease family protein, partial [Sphingomicrobium sp.]
MTFWAYILRCRDDSYYTGHTDNLERRVGEHQSGEIRGYTHRRLPVTLAWSQEFVTREEALAAELQVKDWSRAKKDALIRGDWNDLTHWAKPPARRSRPEVSTGSTSARTERERVPTSPVRVEPASSEAEKRSRDILPP